MEDKIYFDLANELFPDCICDPEYLSRVGKHLDDRPGPGDVCEKNFVPRVAKALSFIAEKAYEDGHRDACLES